MQIFAKAERNYNEGLLTEAEAGYRKVVKLAPNTSEAWLKLGNIHVRTGFLEAAIGMYEKCVNANAEDIRCWNNMAITRLKQGMNTLQTATEGGHIKNEEEILKLIKLYTSMSEVISKKTTEVKDENTISF